MLAIVYKFVMIGLPESEANNKHVVTFKNLKNFIASSTGNNFFNLNSNLDDGVLKLELKHYDADRNWCNFFCLYLTD